MQSYTKNATLVIVTFYVLIIAYAGFVMWGLYNYPACTAGVLLACCVMVGVFIRWVR